MAESVERPVPTATGDPAPDHDPLLAARPRPAATDVVPIVPNLLAAFAGFLLLNAAPWVYVFAMDAVGAEIDVHDEVADMFVLTNVRETAGRAVLGALFFAIVIAILQVWQHRRPFPARWPIFLAYPVLLVLIVPESLVLGGTLMSGIVGSLAIAVAFAGQWGMFVALRAISD
jgi:hypothetical protein